MAYRSVVDELVEWADKVRFRDHLLARHAELDARMREQQRALAQARASMQSEQHDVDRLLRGSLARFMARCSAEGLQGRLEREQREAEVAIVRFSGLSHQLDMTRAETAEVEHLLHQLGDVDAGYRRAFDETVQRLASREDELGRYVSASMQEIVRLQHWRRELAEALGAGEGTAGALHVAHAHLRAVRDWVGIGPYWGIGAYGGMVPGAASGATVRDWVRSLATANAWLARFEFELRDIGESLPVDAPLRGFAWGPQHFIELVFSDYLKRNVEAALANLSQVRGEVAVLVGNLRERLAQQDAALKALRDELHEAMVSCA